MRFIVDENLPRRLAAWISEAGHSAQHVSDLGLLGQADAAIWAEAERQTAVIITRDADFVSLARAPGTVAVVRLLIGNCSTPVLIARLEALWPEIEKRLDGRERLVEIG
jgi:predicted nuclease of predicted toxin-antitoxin system